MAEVQGAEGHQASPKAQPDAKRQQLRNVRLLLILPFAATAVLLAPLGILRKSAEVDITLKVSRVSFKMGEQGSGLFRGLTTSALSLVSYQEVNLGLGILENATTIDPKSSTPSTWRQIGKRGETRIVSKDHFSSVTLQDVSINHLAIPPGSVATLSWLESEPNFLKLRVDGEGTAGTIVAGRQLLLSCSACAASGVSSDGDFGSKFLRFATDRRHVVSFRGRPEGITVAFELRPGMKLVEQNVSIDGDVDFTQLEGRHRVSTVISGEGKITFEELGSKEVKIAAGDFLVVKDVKDFFLKTLQVEDGISIVLHGRAGRVHSGPPGFVKDRLPTILEFLYASETWAQWALYLNAVILIGTTSLAILKRLKILREGE